MRDFIQANRKLWNEWTELHLDSNYYDLNGIKAGKITLGMVEQEEVGNISGKTLLHLQWHLGLDTPSWARLGAIVTGVDISDESIRIAQSLSDDLNIPAEFICSDIFE